MSFLVDPKSKRIIAVVETLYGEDVFSVAVIIEKYAPGAYRATSAITEPPKGKKQFFCCDGCEAFLKRCRSREMPDSFFAILRH